jgi:hypothetical protein
VRANTSAPLVPRSSRWTGRRAPDRVADAKHRDVVVVGPAPVDEQARRLVDHDDVGVDEQQVDLGHALGHARTLPEAEPEGWVGLTGGQVVVLLSCHLDIRI